MPSDHKKVLSVILDWWNGRDLRQNAQRIFFDHFGNTILIAEHKNEMIGFSIETGDGEIDGIPVLYSSNKDHPSTVLFMKEIKTKS